MPLPKNPGFSPKLSGQGRLPTAWWAASGRWRAAASSRPGFLAVLLRPSSPRPAIDRDRGEGIRGQCRPGHSRRRGRRHTSKLGGGKFANGAITAAFGRLYNEEHRKWKQIKAIRGQGSSYRFRAGKTIGVRPWSNTFSFEHWDYEIDALPLGADGKPLPTIHPTDAWGNPTPLFAEKAFTGGGPNVWHSFFSPSGVGSINEFTVPGANLYRQYQWTVSIVRGAPSHGSNLDPYLHIYTPEE